MGINVGLRNNQTTSNQISRWFWAFATISRPFRDRLDSPIRLDHGFQLCSDRVFTPGGISKRGEQCEVVTVNVLRSLEARSSACLFETRDLIANCGRQFLRKCEGKLFGCSGGEAG